MIAPEPRLARPATVSEARKEKSALSKKEAEHDAELVRRFNGGDAAAFDEIIQRHSQKLFSVAVGLLRNQSDAEEIVQDTFVRAHRGLAKFRGDSSLATWLHHVTVNLSRNRYWYFRRRHKQDTLSIDVPLADSTATFSELLASDAPTTQRLVATQEFTELVTVCMGKLAEPHRSILTMRTILNQSYGEIASALGVQEGTVKSRIARARGNLRALMAEACPEFGEDTLPSSWFEARRPEGTLQRV